MMEKKINGKIYKEIKISKMIINGKEVKDSTIQPQDTIENSSTTVNIITEDDDER